MELRDEQTKKAPFPILVMQLGILTEVRLFIAQHKYAGIYSTLSPNINDVIWVRISINGAKSIDGKSEQFFAFQVMEVREEQFSNASFGIKVMFSGIVIEVSVEQPEKAYRPMLVTVLGIVVF
jgi:hypothetical protein